MKVTPGFSRVNSQTSNESCTEEIPVSQQLVQEPKEKRTFWDKCKTVFMYTKPLLMMMVFDVGLPLALARVVFTLIRRRRLDILGCVFVISYVISAILSVVTGDIRLTLLRDSAVTAMIGGLFLITLIPLKTRWVTIRPMTFLVSQQTLANLPPVTWTDRAGQEHSQSTPNFNWDHIKIYRLFAYATTAGWGTLLMGEFIAKVIMIKSIMPIEDVIMYGYLILLCIMGFMMFVTFTGLFFVRKRTKAFTNDWLRIHDYQVKSTF